MRENRKRQKTETTRENGREMKVRNEKSQTHKQPNKRIENRN